MPLASGLNDNMKRKFAKWMAEQDSVSIDQVSNVWKVTREAAKSLIESYMKQSETQIKVSEDSYVEDETFDLNSDSDSDEDEDDEEDEEDED